MSSYVALIHKDRRSDYGVSFPQFPGLVTAGRTLEEAHRLAEEALAFHVEGMVEDGLAVPEPLPPEQVVKTWKGPAPAWTVIVRLTGPKPKTVRVNISVSTADLAMIDRLARERGLNRSDFIARSAHAVEQWSKTGKGRVTEQLTHLPKSKAGSLRKASSPGDVAVSKVWNHTKRKTGQQQRTATEEPAVRRKPLSRVAASRARQAS
jgi:predicted RNase H-like HicB family nuclease